jgi:hypothetical protein
MGKSGEKYILMVRGKGKIFLEIKTPPSHWGRAPNLLEI